MSRNRTDKPRRNTRQRRVVLEELRKVRSHPTAAELYEIVRHRLPRISLATVYRNLELLADEGLIRKLDVAGGPSRFDGDNVPHWHVRCVRCGRVDDVSGVPADFAIPRLENAGGYEILGHRLEFEGICPACAAFEPAERSLAFGGDGSASRESATRERSPG
jgi:Fur family ferric uptake transcriptional regulator